MRVAGIAAFVIVVVAMPVAARAAIQPGQPSSRAITSDADSSSVRFTEAPRADHSRPAVEPAQSVTQELVVVVRPGPLTVSPGTFRVELPRTHDNRFEASLPDITVVDARGSLDGWRTTLTLSEIDGASSRSIRLKLVPADPSVVYGDAYGVERSRSITLNVGTPALLCTADAQAGGGTYRCSGRIDAEIDQAPPDRITLTFTTDVR